MATSQHESDYSSDDEMAFDEEYFARTYRPLSNLPTPPPSSRNSYATQNPKGLLEDGELLESALLGPAIHLVNLVPPAASLVTPSVPLVHEILARANLPRDTVALAVCILDSLGSKFALSWRLVCPLAEVLPASSKRHTLPAGPLAVAAQLHIDCVNPEVIVLAALAIAVKFLDDACHEPTEYYSAVWGCGMWTCGQIAVTERCIMESLDYRILPLWDRELIGDAVADMERAARQATAPLPRPRHTSSRGAAGGDDYHKRSMSSGKAVYGLGHQLTPVETPISENVPATVALHGDHIRAAFGSGCPAAQVTPESLHLPLAVQRKKFGAGEGILNDL